VFTNHYGENYRDILRRIYASSDSVVTVSADYRARLSAFLDVPIRTIQRVPNGVDVRYLANIAARARAANGRVEPIVVVPARLSPLKGLETAVEASKLVGGMLRIVVCSPTGRTSSEELKYLAELLVLAGPNPNIEFVRCTREGLVERMATARCVALPSRIEGVSIALLEALAIGAPVVASVVGGTVEVIQDGVNGTLVPPDRPDLLAEALLDVVTMSRKLSMQRRTAGERTIRQHHRLEQMLAHYEKLLSAYAV
jgi:glycosyltransferase involved in cell wall biosynthesis